MGHSMGGLIALDYVVSKGEDGSHRRWCSPARPSTPRRPAALQAKLAPLIGKVAPNLGVLLLGADNVSRDPVVVKDYENDPLNHNGKVRARTGAEMLLSVQRVVDGCRGITAAGAGACTAPTTSWCPVAGSQLIDDTIGSPTRP